jgi:pilus assembly protein CpaC
MYDVNVSYDISALKQQAYEMFPGEKDLNVVRMHDTITLSGRVSSANVLSQALALAKAFAPEGKVANLVEVGGGHQVMLEVRVAEISKQTSKRLGINFGAVSGENFFVSTLAGLSGLTDAIGGTISASSNVNALMRFSTGSVTWTGLIDALQEDGMVKILAKPTLIALSGQEASFLAGGEYPIPVPQGLGTAAIEYREYGVALSFKPVVLSHDRINIVVTPEVSDLDFSTAIQYQGFVIPGLNTRRATTTIELGDGQSFAIAGLLKDNVRDVISKFPLLGDIPILGALFRSRSFQKSETELVIVVTPRLVKPLNMDEQTLPTDFYVEPNNAEIYLEGMLQGKAPQSKSHVSPELEGEFGHSMPDAE